MVSLDAPEDGLVHTEPNTTLFLGEVNRGKGTLYIAENCMNWKNDEPNHTLTLEYPSISLHAISRDTSNFPHECLFLLLDSPVQATDEDPDPESDVSEVRFVPDNEDNIKALYDAVTECQELHPDPQDVDSEEEEEQDITNFLLHGQFYTADTLPEEIHLSEEGQAVLQRLQISTNGNMDVPMSGLNGGGADQFEDADEDMDDDR